MATTTATLPVCVYCGTARPADQTRCETCDRPWIDVRVGAGNAASAIPVSAAAGAVISGGESNGVGTQPPASPVMPAAAAATTAPAVEEVDPEGTWDPPPGRRREWSMWAIPAVLAAAVLAVYALIFFGAFDNGTTTTTETATPTTVAASTTDIATTAPTSTTAPPTTTTAATTTTTTTLPPPDPAGFSPVGNPIAIASLSLRAGGIGPLEIGEPGPDIIGRLVASLGTAEQTGFEGIEAWVCEGEDGFWVSWAGLTAIFAGDPGNGTFVGFRFEEQPSATSHTDLATLSGVRIGDSISDLEAVYSQYTITYDVVDGQAHFSLIDGDELLLWGPVSSIDSSGRIVGIYSPHACASA